MQRFFLFLMFVFILGSALEPAYAQPPQMGGLGSQSIRMDGLSGGGMGGQSQDNPPQEAIAACSGKQDGTACSFTVSGQCRSMQGQSACVPEGGPNGRPQSQQGYGHF